MIAVDIQKRLVGAGGEMLLQLQCGIAKGQLVTLYGESGAGKTSTLRMLAGLLTPDEGNIVVEGQPWFNAEKGMNLAPQNRHIGVVFQDYALFPNMTVRQNLKYALGKRKDGAIIGELIEIMGLGDLGERRPKTLSGGQQQRAALARALVQRPKVLLLDEPLSALDARTRLRLQDHLLQLHKEYGLTTILVSHDVAEVHKLSDWVFVLENGKLINQGPPSQVFMG
ncbi:MAG: ABC transporter ATP-binding protein, partial [Flavobacteriaceae bacterium]